MKQCVQKIINITRTSACFSFIHIYVYYYIFIAFIVSPFIIITCVMATDKCLVFFVI